MKKRIFLTTTLVVLTLCGFPKFPTLANPAPN